jgi:hypothetical protein
MAGCLPSKLTEKAEDLSFNISYQVLTLACRGLVSLEERGKANPSMSYAQRAPTQKSPASLPRTPRSVRMTPCHFNSPCALNLRDPAPTPAGTSLGIAGRRNPGRLPPVPEENGETGRGAEANGGEDEEMAEWEVIAPSPTWQAFEQMVRQVCSFSSVLSPYHISLYVVCIRPHGDTVISTTFLK